MISYIQEFLYEEELRDQQTARSIASQTRPDEAGDVAISLYGITTKWEAPDPRAEDAEAVASAGFTYVAIYFYY